MTGPAAYKQLGAKCTEKVETTVPDSYSLALRKIAQARGVSTSALLRSMIVNRVHYETQVCRHIVPLGTPGEYASFPQNCVSALKKATD